MLRCLLVLLILSLEHLVHGGDTDWDFFVFTQQWTPSVCVDAKSEHSDCVIPEQVTGWTVHGLWPNKKGTELPNFCNNSLKFDWNKIKSLQKNLTAQWPNIFADTNKTDFWSHEWDKHGTCAVTLPATNNEFHYFSKALELNTQLNLVQALKSFGVLPSNKTGYEFEWVVTRLAKYYRTTPKLQCTYDKKTKRQLFMEVELCLDKSFKFVECDNGRKLTEGECRHGETTYLLPLPNTLPPLKQPLIQMIST